MIFLRILFAKYMEMERSVCFLEYMTFTVEVPVSENKMQEMKKANIKEIQNLEDYETFELVEDVRQETEFKARLVARGFQ